MNILKACHEARLAIANAQTLLREVQDQRCDREARRLEESLEAIGKIIEDSTPR